MDKEIATRNLKDTADALSNIGVRHFITDGTLLGYVRENDFIKHDQDIDFGVFKEDFDYNRLGELIEEMLRRGFNLNSLLGNFNKYFELSFRREGVKVDIFFFFHDPENEVYFFHAFQNGYRNGASDVITYFYPDRLLKSMEGVVWKDADIVIPTATKEYLEFKYGQEWTEPVVDWDWKFGPKNIWKNPTK